MNVNYYKTRAYILAGLFVVFFFFLLSAGFIIERRRSDTEIAETQLIIDSLTATVGGLNETIRFTDIERERLAAIYEQDKETIRKLEQGNRKLEVTNKEIARLLDEQERIIKELTAINTGIRDSSSTITDGLGRAIEEVERLITDIQDREN